VAPAATVGLLCIPVEQPTRYQLTVNLATAKAIAVTIPPGGLAGADEVSPFP
jgi:putative ABC transport system substrate-binding protein